MKQTIVLTGGGTAGHVMPNLALLDGLREMGFGIVYIGGKNGMEQKLAEQAGLPYYGVSTGKMRRYWSAKNLTDPFRVVKGVGEAVALIRKLKPALVFSKGGFVVVPVVMAARLCGVPCVIHEGDSTPGLATKLAMPFARRICATFPETMRLLPKKKAVLTGVPIRRELFNGDAAVGRAFAGASGSKPVLLVMGGSSGARAINIAVRAALPLLTKQFFVAHICGKNQVDESVTAAGYVQFEFVAKELPDLLAAADIVVSRAGANAVNEFLALQKPALLIPLPLTQSRGDQIDNAESFARQGFAMMLPEEDMTAESLATAVDALFTERVQYIAAMKKSALADGVTEVLRVIQETMGNKYIATKGE